MNIHTGASPIITQLHQYLVELNMRFRPSTRSSASLGGQCGQQSSVAPSQPTGFQISRLWRTSKSTNSLTPDSTLPLTSTEEEQGSKGTLHNLVTNSPAEPASGIQSPGIQSPDIQLPAVNVDTPTSQSHSVACLQDGKSVTSTPPSIWESTLDIAATMLRDYDLPALDRDTLSSTSSAENI